MRKSLIPFLVASATAYETAKTLAALDDEAINAQFAAMVSEIDTNNDGQITAEEIAAHTEVKFRQSMVETAVNEFKQIDTDGNGEVTIEELLAQIEDEKVHDEVRNRFTVTDADKNGILTQNEIVDVMTKQLDQDENASYVEFIKEHDKDGDEKLTLDELLASFTEKELEEVKQDVTDAFRFADKNTDNVLDFDEVVAMLQAANVNGASATAERQQHFLTEAKEFLDGAFFFSVGDLKRGQKIALMADLFSDKAMMEQAEEQEKRRREMHNLDGEKNEKPKDPRFDPESPEFDIDAIMQHLQELAQKGELKYDSTPETAEEILSQEGKDPFEGDVGAQATIEKIAKMYEQKDEL